MFNFFKEGQMNAQEEAVQNKQESPESKESIELAQEKIKKAFGRFTQQV